MDNFVSYSDLRENLKSRLDTVCRDHAPLLVRRRGGEDVVILAREDYDALEETAYLLKSPANARRLLAALGGKPEESITYPSLEALKDELGI